MNGKGFFKTTCALLMLCSHSAFPQAATRVEMTNGVCSIDEDVASVAADDALFEELRSCIEAGGRLSSLDTFGLTVLESGLQSTQSTDAALIEAIDEAEAAQESVREFAGFRLGVGIAFTGLSEAHIDDVSIEGGTVSVNQSARNRGALMLEGHRFFFQRELQGGFGTVGHGPFFALTITDEEGADPFSSYGVGYMAGVKDAAATDSTSWNIGIGAFVNTKAASLRRGVVDGGATLQTDPSKLLRTRDQTGWMLIFSTTW